ncbi:MAG TPA: hypothetical protein VGA78_05305 [Gemmatimonadales bacterium]
MKQPTQKRSAKRRTIREEDAKNATRMKGRTDRKQEFRKIGRRPAGY